MYSSTTPDSPMTPNVKDGESHGPGAENLSSTVSRSNSTPTIPGTLQSGGLSFVTCGSKKPTGFNSTKEILGTCHFGPFKSGIRHRGA